MPQQKSLSLLLVVLVALGAAIAGGVIAGSLVEVERPAESTETPRRDDDPARLARLEDRIEKLIARLESVERRPSEIASRPPPLGGGEVDARTSLDDADGRATEPDAAATASAAADRVSGWVGKAFTNGMADELFMELGASKDEIGPLVDAIQAAIADNPNDADLQVALATALTAQVLFTIPPGPEQGMAFAPVGAAYEAALRIDPKHWQAHYGRAFGTSMAPEFLQMRPAAIKQFEELVRMQESESSAPEHVKAYQRLGTLYKDAGNAAKAREVWARGSSRFPDNKEIAESIRLIGEK